MLAPLVLAPLLARQFPQDQRRPQPTGRFCRPAAARRPGDAGRLPRPRRPVRGRADGARAASRRPRPTRRWRRSAFARDAGLKGRVFNHYGYGGYLIMRRHPDLHRRPRRAFGGDFITALGPRCRERCATRSHFEALARSLGHRLDAVAQPTSLPTACSRACPAGAAGLRRRGRGDLRARETLVLQHDPGAGADRRTAGRLSV